MLIMLQFIARKILCLHVLYFAKMLKTGLVMVSYTFFSSTSCLTFNINISNGRTTITTTSDINI